MRICMCNVAIVVGQNEQYNNGFLDKTTTGQVFGAKRKRTHSKMFTLLSLLILFFLKRHILLPLGLRPV